MGHLVKVIYSCSVEWRIELSSLDIRDRVDSSAMREIESKRNSVFAAADLRECNLLRPTTTNLLMESLLEVEGFFPEKMRFSSWHRKRLFCRNLERIFFLFLFLCKCSSEKICISWQTGSSIECGEEVKIGCISRSKSLASCTSCTVIKQVQVP